MIEGCNYVEGIKALKQRWELRSESLYESFLNSHASVKREQELH